MTPKPPRHDELLDRLLDDDARSRDEHAADVAGLGFDFAAIERRLSAHVDAHASAARRAHRAAGSPGGTLETLREQHLTDAELRQRICAREAHVTQRELEGWSREDLESKLAYLIELDREPPGEAG